MDKLSPNPYHTHTHTYTFPIYLLKQWLIQAGRSWTNYPPTHTTHKHTHTHTFPIYLLKQGWFGQADHKFCFDFIRKIHANSHAKFMWMFCLHFREDGEGVSWELGYSLGLSIFLKDVQIKKDEISFIQTAIYSEFHKPQHIQTPVDSTLGFLNRCWNITEQTRPVCVAPGFWAQLQGLAVNGCCFSPEDRALCLEHCYRTSSSEDTV